MIFRAEKGLAPWSSAKQEICHKFQSLHTMPCNKKVGLLKTCAQKSAKDLMIRYAC